jgi:hypothetical protein
VNERTEGEAVGTLDEIDAEFSGLLAEIVTEIGEQAGAARIVPDFAESVSRARMLDPDAVSEAMVSAARELAPVIPIHHVDEAEAGPDPEFADFLADVRRDREAVAERRKLSGIPAAPMPERGRGRGILWVLGACAAAVALWFGLSQGDWLARDQGSDERHLQAPFNEVGSPRQQAAEKKVRSRRAATPAEADEASIEDGTEPEEQAEDDPTEASEPESLTELERERDSKRSTRSRRGKRPAELEPAPTLEDQLRELDAQAQRKLAAKDRAGAEADYREIIRRGKRGRYVQLAYGDLFTIVRTTRGPGAEAELWQEYVRRFPRGPHADDARSGLCRRMGQGSARSRCWSDYLDDFPGGTHRAQAEEESNQ